MTGTVKYPISAKESRALRRLQREALAPSPYVFVSERGAPLSVAGYQRMIARAGEAAKFTFLIHSHMLRHGYGYKLANDGQDTRAIQAYLGHRSIQSTVRYKLWHLIASRISGATEGAKGTDPFMPTTLQERGKDLVAGTSICRRGNIYSRSQYFRLI